MTEAYSLSSNSLERMQGIHPHLKGLLLVAIMDSPVDFGIPPYGGKRTAEEQHTLYLQGSSQCDGFTTMSEHQIGSAFDFFPYVNGKADYDMRYVLLIAGHIMGTAKRMGIELAWGGDWDSDLDLDDQTLNDLVHFQSDERLPELTTA